MQRYSTPKININIPVEAVDELWFTIADLNGTEILTKTIKDIGIEDNHFVVRLSQEDTSKLPEDSYVKIQTRVLYTDGQSFGSRIYKIKVEDVLKDGIME